MGSLEEEELVQMVHDFIESESPSPMCSSSSHSLSLNHQTKYFTLQEILRSGTDAETEVLETVLKHMRKKRDVEKTTSLKKWLVMRLKMDGYTASLCQTSWVTTLGCPGGDYEYIDIMMRNENGDSVRMIVDIDFKSQFELARPTSTYTELSDTLPVIFVGNEDKLNKIISLLCSAAKQSLKERGLHIPPWRTTTYMQSKWLSDHCPKVSTTPFTRENKEAQAGAHGSSKFSKWAPPKVKPKRRDLGGGSGLSSQFSTMSINCW